MASLKAKAAKAKKTIDLKSYTGSEENQFYFGDAFRGEMPILIYGGNQTAARQYFDLVWDARKPGKEKFRKDFIKRLNESKY